MRIDQYGVVTHVSVSITLHVVLARNLVIGHAIWRQYGSNAKIIGIAIRW
jgi:hypothetical protein